MPKNITFSPKKKTKVSSDDRAYRSHFDIAYRNKGHMPVTLTQMGLKEKYAERLLKAFDDIVSVKMNSGGVRTSPAEVIGYCLRTWVPPEFFEYQNRASRRAGGERFERTARATSRRIENQY